MAKSPHARWPNPVSTPFPPPKPQGFGHLSNSIDLVSRDDLASSEERGRRRSSSSCTPRYWKAGGISSICTTQPTPQASLPLSPTSLPHLPWGAGRRGSIQFEPPPQPPSPHIPKSSSCYPPHFFNHIFGELPAPLPPHHCCTCALHALPPPCPPSLATCHQLPAGQQLVPQVLLLDADGADDGLADVQPPLPLACELEGEGGASGGDGAPLASAEQEPGIVVSGFCFLPIERNAVVGYLVGSSKQIPFREASSFVEGRRRSS